MATAITPLANITLGSAASSVTFSSVTGTYRDLLLVANTGLSSAGQTINIQFNNDTTGSNYANTVMYGTGSAAGAMSLTGAIYAAIYGQTASTVSANVIVSILDYSSTDKHKPTLSRNNDSGYVVECAAGRWANTAAITIVKIYPGAGNFVSGSTFALYGVSS